MDTMALSKSATRILRPLLFLCGLLLSTIGRDARAGLVVDTVPVGGVNQVFSPLFSGWGRGLTFTTGSVAGNTISDIKVQVTGNPTSGSFNMGLYISDTGGLPTGSLLASTTFSVTSLTGTSLVSPTSLGTLGTYSLSANTMYSLTVYNSTMSGNWLGAKNATPFTTSEGYSVNNGLFTTSVPSYTSASDRTAVQLSVVPEPSAFGILMLGVLPGVVHLVQRRRFDPTRRSRLRPIPPPRWW